MNNSSKSVNEFIEAMLSWEVWFQKERRPVVNGVRTHSNEKDSEAKERLENIFSRYLTSKAILKYGARLQTLSTQNPPEYDQKVVECVKASESKSEVIAQQNTGFKTKIKYVLAFEEGWKINEAYMEDGSKSQGWGIKKSL